MYRDPPPIPPEEGTWGQLPDVIESTTRVWVAHPYWWRSETTFGADTTILVKDADVFWQREANGDVHSNEQREHGGWTTVVEERLLDPAPLIGIYRLARQGETMLLGRKAVEVTAIPRHRDLSHDFGTLADELALAVDSERGILLRAAVTVDGEVLSTYEVTEIAFDEHISPDLFKLLR